MLIKYSNVSMNFSSVSVYEDRQRKDKMSKYMNIK